MIPTLVKIPVSLAQQLATAVVRGGLAGATMLVHRVLPSGPDAKPTTAPKPGPTVSTEPVRQPPAPEHAPTPGATTTLADPAPATAGAATRATAKRATARKGPAKKATPPRKSAASATAAQKTVAKKTPARKTAPTKPAATLDEPAAPVDDDPIVYSSGPDA